MSDADIYAVLSKRLLVARNAAGISQEQLGVRMGLPEDVASTQVNRYEKGKRRPTLYKIEQMAVALGLPLPALVAKDDQLALLIGAFAKLPKRKQQAVLRQVLDSLGAEEADEVRAQIENTTPPAKAPPKGRRTI